MGVATGGMSLGLTGTAAAGTLIGGVGYGTYNLVNGSDTTALGWAKSMIGGGFVSAVGYKIAHIPKNNTTYRYKINYNHQYVEASLYERMFTKSTNINNIYGNSADDFFVVAPSETALQKHINHISQYGTIDAPIEVQKLAHGGYEIVDGHHRWAAAIQMGLNEVPIIIKNYNN